MKTAYKSALFKDQLEPLKNELIEIQLLNEQDDLELMNDYNISSIHYLIDKEENKCEISHILNIIKNKNEDYTFLQKVVSKAKEKKCGVVIHADITYQDFILHDGLDSFIYFTKENNVSWHIENISNKNYSDEETIFFAPICICNFINQITEKKAAFPLLDITHYQILMRSFDSNLHENLQNALRLYRSSNTLIHLSDAIGCGMKEQGGIHGCNFKYNLPLLTKIINEIKDTNTLCVLESAEDDFVKRSNARWLKKEIERILYGI